MADLQFDRLGHIICPVCVRPMRLAWLETSKEFHQGEFVCAECDMAQEVRLPRPLPGVRKRLWVRRG